METMSNITVTLINCQREGFPIISIDHLLQRYEPGVTAIITVHGYQTGSPMEAGIYLTCKI